MRVGRFRIVTDIRRIFNNGSKNIPLNGMRYFTENCSLSHTFFFVLNSVTTHEGGGCRLLRTVGSVYQITYSHVREYPNMFILQFILISKILTLKQAPSKFKKKGSFRGVKDPYKIFMLIHFVKRLTENVPNITY
jgi:hypothetical protein